MRFISSVLLVAIAGCPPMQLVVPAQDPTPPSAVWLQADIPGRPFVNTTLNGPPASGEMADNDRVTITARADDPDGGVKAVRIWMTTKRTRPGTIEGPTLAGMPEAETVSSATVGQPANATEAVTTDFEVEPRIGAFWDVELDIFAEAENFHGGVSRTATLSLHVRRVGLRLHVIPLSDDDGGLAPQVTAAQFVDVVARANGVFRGTGLRLLFDPATDWQPMSETGMNRDQTIFARGNAIADTLPGRILVLLRWGGDVNNVTGNGNAYPPPGAGPRPSSVNDNDQRYVALPSLYPATGLSFLTLGNGSFVAHELGHYLGLYHTFPGWDGVNPVYGTSTGSAAAADQALVAFILAGGGTIDALDGDLLADTPPDPGSILYDLHGQSVCADRKLAVSGTNAGGQAVSFTFEPDTRNVMSYHAVCGTAPDLDHQTFSANQVVRMHHTLTTPQRDHLLNPP